MLLLLIGGFIGAICLHLWPREPLLLECAHKVYSGKSTVWPEWINDHQLLICRSRRYDPGQFFLCDIATGREQPLPALNRSLSLERKQDAAISPDGQWLLWNNGEHVSSITAIHLDGSHQYQWEVSDEGAMRWMADSRHWVYFTNKKENKGDSLRGMTSAIIYDALEPHHKMVISLPLAEQIFGPTFTTSGHMIDLIEDWGTDNTFQVTGVTERCFLPAVQRLRQYQVHRPQPVGVDNIKVEEVEINHKGDRLVWALSGRRVPPQYARLLHRFWPRINLTPSPVVMIWVTWLDGSHPQELGYQPLKAKDADGTIDYADAGWVDVIHWLPDDRQISFMMRFKDPEEIYTLPAN